MRRWRLVVLAVAVALAGGCAGETGPAGRATSDPGGVVLPAPSSTTDDPHARLQAAIDAFVEAAADLPTNAAITPEQEAIVGEPYAVAKDLSESAEAAGTTLVVVFPVYATMPGTTFGMLWTSTHAGVTRIGLTTTWDEQVALLNAWVLTQPPGAYETLVQPPSGDL